MLDAVREGMRPGGVARRRPVNNPNRTLHRRAKATFRRVRFLSGVRLGVLELSPQITGTQRKALEFWIRRMPPAFQSRLPSLKLTVADRLMLVRTSVFINENPFREKPLSGKPGAASLTHAASFIPERYVVLDAKLFRRRVELGRILYHELCHFLWPKLGNPRREKFATLLVREIRRGVTGELGYSSEWRKSFLIAGAPGVGKMSLRGRRWREYVCESFCDTGSFVLLGRERRANHSEYTLSGTALARRCSEWSGLVFGRT